MIEVTWQAIPLAVEVMQKARDENPRGDLYLTIDSEKLLAMFKQNVAELELAIQFDNDAEDKIADCLNYLSFILHRRRLERTEPTIINDHSNLVSLALAVTACLDGCYHCQIDQCRAEAHNTLRRALFQATGVPYVPKREREDQGLLPGKPGQVIGDSRPPWPISKLVQ